MSAQVETPGGDDDRQWLTFWLIYFAFSGVERFTDVLLSHLPCAAAPRRRRAFGTFGL